MRNTDQISHQAFYLFIFASVVETLLGFFIHFFIRILCSGKTLFIECIRRCNERADSVTARKLSICYANVVEVKSDDQVRFLRFAGFGHLRNQLP